MKGWEKSGARGRRNTVLTWTRNAQRLSQHRIDEDAERPEGATYRSPEQARKTSDTLG